MKIVEIVALENGAHRNQFCDFDLPAVPDGWAVIPDDVVCENFPFGEIEVASVDGVMTVVKWTPVEIPEDVEPEPIEPEPTTEEILNAMLGVSE